MAMAWRRHRRILEAEQLAIRLGVDEEPSHQWASSGDFTQSPSAPSSIAGPVGTRRFESEVLGALSGALNAEVH